MRNTKIVHSIRKEGVTIANRALYCSLKGWNFAGGHFLLLYSHTPFALKNVSSIAELWIFIVVLLKYISSVHFSSTKVMTRYIRISQCRLWSLSRSSIFQFLYVIVKVQWVRIGKSSSACHVLSTKNFFHGDLHLLTAGGVRNFFCFKYDLWNVAWRKPLSNSLLYTCDHLVVESTKKKANIRMNMQIELNSAKASC